MTERKAHYDLYTARGDRGVHILSLLLLEGCWTDVHSSITWEPRELSSGLTRYTITLEGYHTSLRDLLDDVPWGLPDAVLLVEMIPPAKPGGYEMCTYRPKAARVEANA